MTNHNDTIRTDNYLTANHLTRAHAALLATWDALAATNEAEAIRASLTDQASGYCDQSADELENPAVAMAVDNLQMLWGDNDWSVWAGLVTDTAKEWLATRQPTDPITATITIDGEEAQALTEVLAEEEATLASGTVSDIANEDRAEAERLAKIAVIIGRVNDRLNVTDGAMTIGCDIALTLEEVLAIAYAIEDIGLVGFMDADSDEIGEEEAKRCHEVYATVYSVRINKLANAITQLIAEMPVLPEILQNADGWLGSVIAQARANT